MTDDVGFAASSTFGGPIPPLTFDALAAQGLRYSRFRTMALCSRPADRAQPPRGERRGDTANGNVREVETGPCPLRVRV